MTREDTESRKEHGDNKGSFQKVLRIVTVLIFVASDFVPFKINGRR